MDSETKTPEAADFPNKWAFVVGVTEYQSIPKLKFSGNDATKIAQSLREQLQFPANNIMELHSLSDVQPERDHILNSLNKHCTERGIGEDDLLVFFFSGHGVIDSGDKKDYILPTRANLGTLKDTGIRVETIIEYLKKSNCKNIVMFIDACREMIPGEKGAKGVTPIGEASKQALKQSGIITFFSCGPTDSSYEIEDLGHSSFTYCLLDAIKSKKCSTVEELDEYLREKVPPLNEKYKKGIQLPYLIVEPLQKKALRILSGLAQKVESQRDIEQLIQTLAWLYYDLKLEPYYYERAKEVLDRVRQGNVDEKRLRMIEHLVKGQLTPSNFMVTWKAIEMSKFISGPAIQKDLGPIQ